MKNIYLTLDTETKGGASAPEGIYDLGGYIHDRAGNVLASFHYIIAEHFHDIDQAFYGKQNFDRYLRMIMDGTATMIPTEAEAIEATQRLCDYYGVNTVMAFNTGFDYCKTACRDLLEGREFIDLFLMACQTLAIRKKYGDFCRANELYSRSGKSVATSAESFYAYLTNNPEYAEEHTALEDAKIEMQIFNACIKAHEAFTKNCHFYDYPNKWALIPRR